MSTFIDRIAEYYVQHMAHEALYACLVIPNRRAKAPIRKAIIQRLPQGGFLPTMLTMTEFVERQMEGVKLDGIDLSYQLYHSFCQVHNGLSFDEFLSYAQVLLHDFDDIDMQLADAKEVFSYLSDARAIQLWSPSQDQLSPAQQTYLDFYRKLWPVYHNFISHLREQQYWYKGMAYRQLADGLGQADSHMPWRHVLFAGFGWLSKAEETIIRHLLKAKIAHCLWNVDTYYLDDELMEAGQMFRDYSQWHAELPRQAVSLWRHLPREVEVIGSPGKLAQLRILAQNLQADSSKKHLVVLPDEQMLLPLLNALPQDVLSAINIGMGYPISYTHTYRLLDALCRLHLQVAKHSEYTAANYRLTVPIVMEVLYNPLLEPVIAKDIKQDALLRLSMLSAADMRKLMQASDTADSFAYLFSFVDDKPLALLRRLIRLLEQLFHQPAHGYSLQEADAERQLYPILRRLENLLKHYEQPAHLAAFYLMFKQMAKGLKQQFAYQSDAHIQLMSLADTHLLHFDRVSVLSLNEDSLPRASMPNSFVPIDIKHLFGLSTPQEQMRAQAYAFYSLLQPASRMHLYYSTTAAKLSGGEPSRFLKQLSFEWRQQLAVPVQWQERLLQFDDMQLPPPSYITFAKDEDMMQRLATLAQRGLSPTSISTFVSCPLQFCFKYLWRIRAHEEPEEWIDERLIGNVIHKVMEDIYKPYLSELFPPERYAELLQELPKRIRDAYDAETDAEMMQGYNYLSLQDTEHYMKRFVEHEYKLAMDSAKPLRVLAVELPMQKNMCLDIEGNRWEVCIKGIADRVDEYGGQKRILDYKTGGIDDNKLKGGDIGDYKADKREAIFSHDGYKKQLQLFVYDWISKSPDQDSYSHTGIVAFRKHKAPYYMLHFPPASHELYQELEDHFKALISRIFDPKQPFEPTANAEACQYCDYKNICLKA